MSLDRRTSCKEILHACGLFPSTQIPTPATSRRGGSTDALRRMSSVPFAAQIVYRALAPVQACVDLDVRNGGSNCVTSSFSLARISREFKQTQKTNHTTLSSIWNYLGIQIWIQFSCPNHIKPYTFWCIRWLCWARRPGSEWERGHAVGQEMSSVSTSCLTMQPSSLS